MRMLSLSMLVACSSGLSAEEELTLSATNGAEESFAGEAIAVDAVPDAERPDPFRACDASATYSDLFGRYDADGDGALDAREEETVQAGRGDRSEMQQRMAELQWGMLVTVYDLDGSGALEDAERVTMLEDFTVRCTAIQAKLLADFDADGDGALDADEQDTARATMEEDREAHCAERGEGPPPGARPAIGAVPPPLLDEFDADGDGALSDTELSTLRAALRAHIRAGDPLLPPPPQQ